MTGRLGRFALVAIVPTALDVATLVLLRRGLGWILVLADLTAVGVASVASYLLHRAVTFRSDPYVRWVRMPLAFALVAASAALVDVVVLRSLFVAFGFTTTGGLVAAKVVALAAAALLRGVLYRALLLEVLRREMGQRVERPAPPGDLRASVVVPAYREGSTIGATVEALRAGLAAIAADGGVEIVVVDDGSGDGTADAAAAAGADQVVVLPRNRGKGGAVRAGVGVSRGRVVAFTDADLSYSPDQVARAVLLVEEGWDLAIGNRRHPGSVGSASGLRTLGSRAINLLAALVLLSRPHDTQCGLKAFRSDAARLVFGLGRLDGFAFDVEVLHLAERHGLTLAEMPVEVRRSDRSSVRVVTDTLRLLGDLWEVRHLSATGAYELGATGAEALPSGVGRPAGPAPG
ncbi:MAG: glycosyltransferase [Acidimicrobiia bacterium]